MTRAKMIVAAARAAIGTPFRHQGRIVGKALDCAGLAVHAATAAGVSISDETHYPRTPGGGRLESALDRQTDIVRVDPNNLQDGDILLMRFGREPQHIAIVAGENIIHSYERVGRVVEHGLNAEWQSRIVRAYRVIEVEA